MLGYHLKPSKATVKALERNREKNLDSVELHSDRLLEDALLAVEGDLANAVNKLPTRSGKLYDQMAAIKIKPALKNIMNAGFMGEMKKIVDGYGVMTVVTRSMLEKLGYNPLFDDADKTTIKALKLQSYQGFEDIANTTLSRLNKEIFDASITNRSIIDMTDSIRREINGIYRQGFSDDADSLLEFIANNRDDPAQEERVARAIEELHKVHAKDVIGRNMRRYAGQMAHDGLMQFDSAYNKLKADEVGLNHYRYTGTSVRDSREWCVSHLNRIMSEEEIINEWSNNSWGGKAIGSPFIVRGGYNCRHHWQPVDPEWFNDSEIDND